MNNNNLIIETLDGQALDLGKDFSITLDLVSTPFDSEVLRGSSSLPVTFPATPANKRKLKFPHNPASKNALFVTEVRLKVGGFSLLCKMRVKDAGNEKFTASILAGVGIVADDLKGTKLSDLDTLHHFSEIDLRPYMVFQADFVNGLPSNGSIVKVPLVRYNNAASAVASTVYYAVPYQNSREQLVLDLMAKINAAGTHPQPYSPTRYYTQFEVVFDPATNIYYEASQASHGRPLVPPTFAMGNTYEADSYVYDALGDCYRCVLTHQNQDISNTTYWEFVLDYPFWFGFVGMSWRDVWVQEQTPRWWWYTDPADNYSVEAVPVIYGADAARRIKLIDKTAGNPYPMDYLRSFDVNVSNHFSMVQQAVFPGPDETYTMVMHLMKNRAKFYPEIKYAFPPIYNPAAYQEDTPDYSYFNYFMATDDDLANDELPYYRNIYTTTQYLNSPQLFLFYIFEKIAEKLGYTLDYSAFNNPYYAEYLQILVYNNNSFEGFINAYFEKHQHGTPYNVINLKQHVPDMTVSDFLNSVRNYLGLHIDFSLFTKTMTVQPLRELVVNISAQETDWTGICEPNAVVNEIEEDGAVLSFEGDSSDKLWEERVKPLEDMTVNAPVQSFEDLPAMPQNLTEVRMVLDENVYYKAAYDEDGEFYFWEFYSEPYHSLTVGNGAASITTTCAPMLMYKGFDEKLNGDRYWLVPQILQQASLTGLGKPRQPFGLRMMFWRGMQREATLTNGNYTQGFLYPMASSDTVDFFGNAIGQKSLRFEGQAGLYENMWKDFLTFRDNSKPVKYQARLESYHLSNLSFGRAIRINNLRYLIKRVRVTFPIRKTAEVELYKL